LVALAILNEHEKRKKKNDTEENDEEEGIGEEIFSVTKAMSAFILPIVTELGNLTPDYAETNSSDWA